MKYVTADAPLWIVSRVMISSRCDELLSCWEQATTTFSAEDIHDLRVASRRLREAVTLFTPCYPAKKFSRMKAEVKLLTNLLGTMRNTDEALVFFTPLVSSLPEAIAPQLETYLATMRNKRTKELKHLADRLKKVDLALVRYELQRALKRPCLFETSPYDPFMPISSFFTIKLQEREIILQQLLPESLCEQNISAQHRLRIAVKKYRYTFELTAPIVTAGYKELYAVIKAFQEVLGKIHDLDVFMELLREQEFTPDCSTFLANEISSRRSAFYAEYLTLHATHPIDQLGARARELL